MKYNFKIIEEKWIKYWEKNNTYKFVDNNLQKKFYVLDMFPYPSGSGLHVGHIKGYLASDIIARYKKMQGFSVLHPIGWDSFGLPAEQYAIQNKKNPHEFVKKNINNFRNQLKNLFFSYDYKLEINTSDEKYYKTTQWIFKKMYLNNLAELKESYVNWSPDLNTVLADEEIIVVNNKRITERGNFPVETKKLKQWILKITNYSEQLLEDIDALEWDEKIKKIQKNWIGKTIKYKFKFFYKQKEYFVYLDNVSDLEKITGIYINKFSPLFNECDEKLKKYKNKEFLNIKVVNSFNKEEIGIYYLENDDFRSDFHIPIFSKKKITKKINIKFPKLEKVIVYKLKDWIFSRQRYWGEPFPIYFDENKKIYVDEKLPVVLPKIDNFFNKKFKISPLEIATEWININNKFTREINTMPNWAGSSWYFLAYLMKNNEDNYEEITSQKMKEKIKRWMPVDIYIGGQEHANLHLLYSRFWYKFLYTIGIVQNKEPFKKLINQGMILGSDGTKMSKSKGNSINTDEIVEKYGGDLLRMNIAFIGDTEQTQQWTQTQILPLQKWLNKVYIFYLDIYKKTNCLDKINDCLNEVNLKNSFIKKCEYLIEKFKPNVLVSELMILFDKFQNVSNVSDSLLKIFVQTLSLLAPAISEEIWINLIKEKESIFLSKWPKIIENENNKINYLVQINNKYKFSIELETSDQEKIFKIMKTNKTLSKLIQNKKIKKIFIFNKKIINIILE